MAKFTSIQNPDGSVSITASKDDWKAFASLDECMSGMPFGLEDLLQEDFEAYREGISAIYKGIR